MKKITFFFIFWILVSCKYFNQIKSDEELTTKIEKEISNAKKSDSIDLQKLTNFEWNSYLILGPYSTIEIEQEKYNVDLSNISENGIEMTDYYYLLVFIKNKKSIKICELKKYGKFDQKKKLKPNR
ncbi:MAG: hypothetical protein H7221_05550 [Flavobacterium sp.]|nr:hypothetical protein [Flavobacterium sp.]